MSWFKKTPKAKEPIKHLPHHRFSPTTERILEEVKTVHSVKKRNQPKKQ
jgi:hypothetical protein